MDALTGASVLVTGANGFIGAHLAKRLRTERLSRLVLVSRHSPNASSDVEVAISKDLTELTSSSWSEMSIPTFDIVFHLGAVTPKTRVDSLNDVVNANVMGTQRLLESLPTKPHRLVFTSAVDVFAPSNGVIREFSPVRSSGLYPVSKLMGEALVSAWANRTGGSAVIARMGHIYGPGEERYEKAIPNFIRAALDNQPLKVHGDGSVLTDLFYVDDAVEALVRAATFPTEEQSTTVIVASHESVSVVTIAEHIVAIVGGHVSIQFDPLKDAGWGTRFSTEKMRRLLGTWPRVPLRDGLESEVEYFKSLHSNE